MSVLNLGNTVKPYVLGSAIILAAWLALIGVLSALKWAGLIGYDDDWVAYLLGCVLIVVVIEAYRRFGLRFRHCLPVAVVAIAALAVLFSQVH